MKRKDGGLVCVRTAWANDAASILAIISAVRAEQEFSLSEPDEMHTLIEEEVRWIETHVEDPCKLAIVAEIEGRIVGMLTFENGHRRRIAHTGELGMTIVKEWRENGIGTALLATLVQWAAMHDKIEKLSLKVHATNVRARALYRKLGFEQEGYFRNDLRYGSGWYVDTVFMSKFVKGD
ncbi:MAG: GNAT family N-acetyltransferase [Deltaproteobacteria bacterium]|nr:GNAT family N-acetyltransferase [Deltaproteobacteria bacterium]